MIYLTQEGKQKLEIKIDNFIKELQLVNNLFEDVEHNHNDIMNKINIYKEILSLSTILSVETFDDVFHTDDENINHYIENIACLPSKYLNGVIILPKITN